MIMAGLCFKGMPPRRTSVKSHVLTEALSIGESRCLMGSDRPLISQSVNQSISSWIKFYLIVNVVQKKGIASVTRK